MFLVKVLCYNHPRLSSAERDRRWLIAAIYGVSLVSIPDRVLGFFRPYQARQLIDSLKAEAQVSIPDRV